MRKKIMVALAVLLAFALPITALAEAGLGEYVYGVWSAWGNRKVTPTDTLDVETRQARELIVKQLYNYRRFVYFNTNAGKWYATSTETPPFMRPGSGHWEDKQFDEAQPIIGRVNGEVEYEGHWFFEQPQQQIDRFEPITQYRSRSKRRMECELSVSDVLLGRGETFQIPYKLASGVKDVSFKLSNPGVAAVSDTGMISAVQVGETDIDIMRGERRIEGLRLTVGERVQALDEGIYSFRLDDTKKYLTPKNSAAQPETQLIASSNARPEKRVFGIDQDNKGAFKIKLIGAQILYLSTNSVGPDKTIRLRQPGEKDSEQKFSMIRLSGGEYMISLPGDDVNFVGLNAAGCAMIKAFDSTDESMRWNLNRESEDILNTGEWIPPVVRNGSSYMSKNYMPEKQHNGIDIGSNGERVSVVSVAAGRVVYAYNGCEHDYGKKKNANGEYDDPCGGEHSFGNVVIVEHEDGLKTTYAHLSRVLVKEGDKVSKGQVLGTSGSTGSSSATHLHFEVRQNNTLQNPRQFIELPKIDGRIK